MSRCFVILGMHRSATSLVAKGLHEAGVNMGESLILPDAGNPRGYYEDVDFVTFNKIILELAGGDWLHPPAEEKILSLRKNKSLMNDIKRLVNKKSQSKLWGFKDPRTVLTIRLFKPYLPEHFFFVCFRDPKDAAKSLVKRNGLDLSYCIKLAHEYNDRLLKFLQESEKNWKFK